LDGVVCRVAAHHFGDPELFMQRSFDVLGPGGFLLLIDTVGADDPGADEALHLLESLRDPSHVRDHTPSAWRRMARKAGFEPEFEDTIQKPLNAKEWMDRMSVEPVTRKRILELINSSRDWFREYLRPHSEGDLLTFHLLECTMLLRK
ncbi:MAG: methyltransferase domain-containing protein, partial [Fimbriimonadales bacterium]